MTDCENCAGYRCPCTCKKDCGRVLPYGRPCPKSPEFDAWYRDFAERVSDARTE